MMRLLLVVVVAVAMVGCGKDKSEDKTGNKPSMKSDDTMGGKPGVAKPGPGEPETLPATPVGKGGDSTVPDGLSVSTGGVGVSVKSGDTGVSVKAGSAGVKVDTGKAGTTVKVGDTGVGVKIDSAGVDTKVDLTGKTDDKDDCVAKCVRTNQMRAVGADQIERDCKAECKK
jgi:hypothetical protein